jgi:hypothetical protein
MQRIWIGLLLLGLLLVMLPGSSNAQPSSSSPAALGSQVAAAAPPATESLREAKLDEANARLDGQRATVELAGGEAFRHLSQVAIEPDRTSWSVGGTTVRREVPTAQVRRVLVEPESRAGLGFGIGCAVGGTAVLTLWSSNRFHGGSATDLVAAVIGTGFVGFLIGASRRLQPPKVVYEAPAAAPAASQAARSANGTAAGSAAEGSEPAAPALEMAADGADLHCRLSSFRAPGGGDLICRPMLRTAVAR